MLLDSNIVIYAALPKNQALRSFIGKHAPAVSIVSYVEVLGYHRLTDRDRRYFEDFFVVSPVLTISIDILECATRLRQQRPMGLGDALIGATALVHELELVTANGDDFRWISDLRVSNPFESKTLTEDLR